MGEKASTLLAALLAGLGPLLLLWPYEFAEDVVEDPDSDGVCMLSFRYCCTGLGTGGASTMR